MEHFVRSALCVCFKILNIRTMPSSFYACLVDTEITDAHMATSSIELKPEDADCYRAVWNSQKELTAVIKLSKKQGGGGKDFRRLNYHKYSQVTLWLNGTPHGQLYLCDIEPAKWA